MEEEPTALCDECGAQKAVAHLCVCGDRQSHIKLCRTCWESKAPAVAKNFMAELAEGRCRYCGSPAGAVDDLKRIADNFPSSCQFLCLSCFTESSRISLPELQAFDEKSDTLPASEQQLRIHEILARVDQHMHRWLAQRLN